MTDTLDQRPGLQTRLVTVQGTPPDFPGYHWTLEKMVHEPDGTVEATITAVRRTPVP